MNNPKLNITELLRKGTGESLEFTFPLSGRHDENIAFTKKSTLTGQITHLGDYLLIDFELNEYKLTEACVRCLTEIEQITSIDRVSESYSLVDAKENSFTLISEDSVTHEQFFDLGPLIDQELLLSKTANALCKDDCAGLCQQCGTDLNKKKCKCLPLAKDSPFNQLKDHFKD